MDLEDTTLVLHSKRLRSKNKIKEIIDKVRLLFHKEKESYSLLYNLLGFIPGSLAPYKIAFTHSSSTPGSKKKLACNERLEFLGDAVLSSVTADYLFNRFRYEREGFLSKSRSRLVCRESLNNIALKIGLDKLIPSSAIGTQHNSHIYGNTFEALIGAIYIDKGYSYCSKFLLERVFPIVPDIEKIIKADNNYKSRLIEWSQREHRTVIFNLLSEEVKNDGCHFTSEVTIDGVPYGLGKGFSKKESQQHAAQEALEAIKAEAQTAKENS